MVAPVRGHARAVVRFGDNEFARADLEGRCNLVGSLSDRRVACSPL